jgi:hypothetical protein
MRSEKERAKRIKVEATNPFRAEVAQQTMRSPLGHANDRPRASKVLFAPPTPEEVSGLAFWKLRDIHAQEVRNQFAHLLNRGSSLE